MFKRSVYPLALCACLSWAGSSQAAELSYTFLEASYTTSADFELDSQNVDRSADGYGIAFAWLMGPIAYSEWRYRNYDLGGREDGQTATARFGVHQRIDSFGYGKLDVFGGVGAEYAKFERESPNQPAYIDDTGLLGYIGLRYAWNPYIEYGVEWGAHNIEKNGKTLDLHAQWNATHALSFRLSYQHADYQTLGPDVTVEGFTVAARITFGQGN